MARKWMDSETGELETPLGTMYYAITQGNHVFLAAGGSEKLPPLVVNRVPYSVSLHLHLQPDGAWASRESYDLHMSRKDTFGDASRAAKDKAYEGIRPAWEEFIAGNQALLVDAEGRFLNNEIGKAEEEIEKARDALEKLEAQREGLLRAEAAL